MVSKNIITLLIVLIFIVGCSGNVQYVCSNGKTVNDPSLCEETKEKTSITKDSSDGMSIADVDEDEKEKEESNVKEVDVVIPTPTEKTEEVTVSGNIPEEIQEILDKSKNVNSLSYRYKEVNKPLELSYLTWIEGNTLKMELPVEKGILYESEIDTVIINLEEKKAIGYCESMKLCEVTGETGEVSYDEYYKPTPYDWVDKIKTAERVSQENMFNRDTLKLNVNNGEMLIWIDSYYGIPLRVEMGSEILEYREPLFNTLSNEDVAFKEKRDDY